MTTRVTISNDGVDRDIAVHLVTVQNLAGRREVVGDKLALVLSPGGEATLHVHECQELRVLEQKKP